MTAAVEDRTTGVTTAPRPARRPPWRRTLLVLHVGSAVGWLGVSAVFLVLTLWLRGVRDAATLRTGYLVHEVMVTWLARPAAIAAALTGVALMLTTTWVRRRRWLWGWWVPVKATLVVATVLITAPSSPDLLRFVMDAPDQVGTPAYTAAQDQLVALAVLHVVVVVTALALSVVRPRRLGRARRTQRGQPIQPGLTRPLS